MSMPIVLLCTLVASPALAQVRVPAEWEPHEATWMQWPYGIESSYRWDFARIIDAIEGYEPVKLVVKNATQRDDAMTFLVNRGVPLSNITFEIRAIDNAWMRDNGPVWVDYGGTAVVQDFAFDGWGGQAPWTRDDDVPCFVATLTGAPCFDANRVVMERGGLEFNGVDTLITTWPWFTDRNPGVTRTKAENAFNKVWGVTRVVWLEDVPTNDFTGGHIDGLARFVDPNTVVVPRHADQSDPSAWLYESAASTIAAAGFTVRRLTIPGAVSYGGVWMDAVYINWLVANGVVVVNGFGHANWDAAAKAEIETFFPAHDVIVTDTREIWYWGGGVHCVTNDQPTIQ